MSLYERNPVVVIDDGIYDLMDDYRKIFCKKEFGCNPEKVSYIKLSEVRNFITTENVDSRSVYFYVFEKIDTAEEYARACELVVTSPNVDIVMLFGQYSRSFDVCGYAATDKFCKIHNIGVHYKFDFDQNPLEDMAEKHRNCLHLMAMFLYLLSLEVGAYDDFSVTLKLNYPSMYCAVQCSLFELKDKINKVKTLEEEEKEKIECLEREKSYRYKMNFSHERNDITSQFVPQIDKDYDKSLSQLSAYYLASEEAFEENVSADVNFTRYTMAEMDEFAKGGPAPDVYQSRSEATKKITTGDDLLRRVSSENEKKINIKLAINLAKNLVATKKPELIPFVIATAVAILVFLLTIVTTYGTYIIKNTASSVDMKLLAICIGVPVAIIVFSALIGFVANLVAFSSVRKIINDIYEIVSQIANGFLSVSEKIREYLNDFITVFCNYHIKDSIIFQCKRRLESIEKDKELILRGTIPLNAEADFLRMLYEYEKEKDDSGHNEKYVDGVYSNEDSYVAYDESFSFQSDNLNLSNDMAHEQELSEMKNYIDVKTCIDAVRDNAQTVVKGTENDSFINSKSPWILQADISQCVNGGVL